MSGDRDRGAAKNVARVRFCGIGRSVCCDGFQDRPVMSCCGARNLLFAGRSQDFDRCHSLLLAVSAAGGARKRPRFGNPPCMLTPLREITTICNCLRLSLGHGGEDRPVMSCCGARNLLFAGRSQDFDRCHSLLLAVSAAGGARKRPRFGNPPCMFSCPKTKRILSRRARQVKAY